MISERLTVIGNALQGRGDGNSNDIFSRFNLYFSSLRVFKNNFLYGIGYEFGYNTEKMLGVGLGSHSEWFDLLATYGLLGSIMLFTFLFTKFKENSETMIIKLGGLIFLILGFLNPNDSFTIYLVVFLLLPLLGSFLQKADYLDNEKIT